MKKFDCSMCKHFSKFVDPTGKVIDTDCCNFKISDDDFERFYLNGCEWHGAKNGCRGFTAKVTDHEVLCK